MVCLPAGCFGWGFRCLAAATTGPDGPATRLPIAVFYVTSIAFSLSASLLTILVSRGLASRVQQLKNMEPAQSQHTVSAGASPTNSCGCPLAIMPAIAVVLAWWKPHAQLAPSAPQRSSNYGEYKPAYHSEQDLFRTTCISDGAYCPRQHTNPRKMQP